MEFNSGFKGLIFLRRTIPTSKTCTHRSHDAHRCWCDPGSSSVCHRDKCIQRGSLLTHHLYQQSPFIFNTRTANVKLERIIKKTSQNTVVGTGTVTRDANGYFTMPSSRQFSLVLIISFDRIKWDERNSNVTLKTGCVC